MNITTIADIFPPTLEYREVFRNALKNQNITVKNTKTRSFIGSIFNLARDLNISSSLGYREYRLLRTVTFVVALPDGSTDQKILEDAIDETQVWFTLCGKKLDLKYTNVDYYNGYKITNTCVMI
jgi:hypothetical protein